MLHNHRFGIQSFQSWQPDHSHTICAPFFSEPRCFIGFHWSGPTEKNKDVWAEEKGIGADSCRAINRIQRPKASREHASQVLDFQIWHLFDVEDIPKFNLL